MVQDRAELEKWYSQDDPWGYEKSADDERRKAFLLSEIPARSYRRVLDIGCGQGFLTRDLPGDLVIGVRNAGDGDLFRLMGALLN